MKVVITDRNFNVKVAPNAKFDVEMCRLVRKLAPSGYELANALNGPQFLSGTYLKKPLVVKDGEIEVPIGAGLGVEIDEVRIKL